MWVVPASAAGYQVEIIVFAYTQPDTDGEQFSADPGLPGSQGVAQLGATEQGTGPMVTPLAPSTYRLNGVMGALRRGGKYRSLLHASWLQPEAGRIRGVYVSTAASAAGSNVSAPDAEQVMGSVRLRVTRFLHADLDLAYFPRAVTPGSTEVPGPVSADHVRLQDSRKIRLNEVHYFDHPLFGVLLQVSRAGGASDAPQE